MTETVRLVGVASSLPEYKRSSDEVDELLSRSGGFKPRRGLIQAMSGIRERRVAADDEHCSDLAADACRKVLASSNVDKADVDLLIFASAGQDLTEPATAHITQSKLGTKAAVFDLKNACNSFLNGMQVAESLILGGSYKTVLLATGEVSSRVISWRPKNLRDFKSCMPGYTVGDAGAAALLVRSDDKRGIFYRKFSSHSEYWDLTTVDGGGSRYPQGDHFYLRSNAPELKVAFREIGLPFVKLAMQEANAKFSDFKRIFVHQVSLPYLYDMLEESDIPADQVEVTIEFLGNMAAASIPVAMAQAFERGAIKRGDRIMCLGLASGISIGAVMIDL